jgi:putative spermidine/putrescine transport system substrate-binding protein
MRKATALRWLGVAAATGITIGTSLAAGSTAGASSVNWATVTSAAAGGGQAALISAAKAEGTLNVITLPPSWANYGTLMKEFTAKYGIKINDAIPDGSSQQELNAIETEKSTSRAPDVVDVGVAFAISGAQSHLFAPYKVAEYSEIPAGDKAANADWYYDYGGYVSIGYDANSFSTAPTTFKSLTNPIYKGSVALDGSPTEANAAFSGVYAAAIANGGSASNIAPGIAFFKTLDSDGNYIPTQSQASSIAAGQVKVGIDWDYLNAAYAAQLKSEHSKVDWKVVIPSDAHFASYYAQAISHDAPHPAAARLWEEFLYSAEGQNGFLAGFARPILLNNLISAGTVNKASLALLPTVTASPATIIPSQNQLNAAKAVVASQWSSV